MTDAHTQGRLKVFNAYADPEIRDEAERFVANVGFSGNARSVADARRLVACWNACIDVDTKLLEQNPAPFSALRAERDELLKQVNQLKREVSEARAKA